jgi:hypothetical protein
MPSIQLSNTAEQVKTTLSETYTRLLNNWVGPLTASTSSTTQFIIQNPNKTNGIGVGNSCISFFSNNLNFESSNVDLCFNIPDSKNFIVTGNGAVMKFNGNGTFSVGQDVDVNYKGLQVFNSCPGLVLKDSDAISGRGCQFIAFVDSTGYCHASIKSVLKDNTYNINTSTLRTLNVEYDEALTIGNRNCPDLFVVRDGFVSFGLGNRINSSYRFNVGTNMRVQSGFEAQSISAGQISTVSTNFSHVMYGVGGYQNTQRCPGCIQEINFISQNLDYWPDPFNLNFTNNTNPYTHTTISSSRNTGNGGSSLCFSITPIGDYYSDRRTLAMQICNDKKVSMQGDLCAYRSCFTSVRTDNLCNLGGFTYLGANLATSSHMIQSQATIDLGRSTGSWVYCFGFDQNRCITNHVWFYKGDVNSSTAAPCCMTLTCNGLSVQSIIYSRTGLSNSGCFCSSGGGANAFIRHNNIALIGDSTSQSAINMSGNICASGILSTNCVVCAANFCSTGITSVNCFATIRGGDILVSGFCVSSTAACVSKQFCANGFYSPSHVICGCSFEQSGQAVNCFCGTLNVGSTCTGIVNSISTAKAWGTVCIRNGWVSNNQSCQFHNVAIISAIGNGVYQIYLPTLCYIKAPLSAIFSTRALSQLPWNYGFGPFNLNDGFSNNGISPISAHLLTCGFNPYTQQNELITNGNYYSSLCFTVTDPNLYQTNWNTFVSSIPTTLPTLINYNTNVVLQQMSPTYRVNYIKGAIDFVIFGS